MELVGVREAARILGVHENTVRNMAADGRLPPAQVLPFSGFKRFDADTVRKVAEGRDTGMSLHLVLRAQTMVVGTLEIQRQEHYDGPPPPESMNNYKVFRDGKEIGRIRHRYRDGAWQLLAVAAQMAGEVK